MKVQKTPLETRRVVEAIEAAATRAITTATRSVPALPLVKEKEGAVTLEDGRTTRVMRLLR
ncbi:MAG TPA: hypothetical protein VM925_31075, partial [Labilithrix sp.]|nr:hypothetical protein [Labilithrix sp.]